jgi:hypothetical protein
MKTNRLIFFSLLIIVGCTSAGYAQGVASPLRYQGLDRSAIVGARSAAMGGSVIASPGDAASLFANPAGLASLTQYEVRVGGSYQINQYKIEQQWHPSDLYDEITILFDNKESYKTRTYDAIQPDWSQRTNRFEGISGAAAIPFDVEGVKIVGAVGYGPTANFDHYFRNNNALDPNVGQLRPEPVPRLKQNQVDTVQWFQYTTQRKGIMYGTTAGIGIEPLDGLRLGARVTFHKGSSDDSQLRNERGRLRLMTKLNSTNLNVLALDSVYFSRTQSGTSDYTGINSLLGIQYEGANVSAGATLQLPWTLERKWNYSVVSTNSAGVTGGILSGIEKYNFPIVLEYGIALRLSKRLTVSLQYAYRNYEKVTQSIAGNAVVDIAAPDTKTYASVPSSGPAAGDSTAYPWISGGALRTGLEFRAASWLQLRGGYREDVQGFSPEGDALMDNPARGSVYSVGVGFSFGMLCVDASYEYARLKYVEAWLSNANYNTKEYSRFIVETGIRF